MMQGRALLDGAKNFLIFLVRAVVFPLAWLWALGLARKHSDTDPRARPKVLAAIVAGVVLAGGGYLMLDDFQDDATLEMYTLTSTRLSQATGASEYQANVDAEAASLGQIAILEEKLAQARANGEDKNATALEENLELANKDLAAARLKQQLLQRNRVFFDEELTPLLNAQDDVGIRNAVTVKGNQWATADYESDQLEAGQGINFDPEDMVQDMKSAMYKKDTAQADMALWMNWLLLPGLVGVFYAPLSMALGNVLKHAWVPSDSVGFKEYPGASMGWFLLLGGFGVPALFFAAWAFWDMDVRSSEGQISL
ncbi:MAG: hypothetical protein ACPHID_04955 [Thermoplasmatota archaeon]